MVSQPQGLQALMAPRQPQQPQRPQPQQQAQQMDPRMNAAMSVVQEDVPESLRALVNKNDFAQKAMELLQSAGGQAAMNQPTPQPPTVAQRTDQRAAEGVAGLMQRLAPGMQQRGQQVQRAQARKMLGGGLSMQAAPNMQRMANGGIVGYAGPDGSVVGANSKGPIPQMSPEENAQMLKYLEGLKKFDYYDKNPDKVSPEGRQALELERRMFEEQFPNAFRQKVNDMMYGPSEGMAMGGQVKRFQTGDLVEADDDVVAAMLAENAQLTGYTGPSAEERRAALADEAVARAQLREARRQEQRTRQELAGRGLTGSQINELLSRKVDTVDPSGIDERKQPQFDTRSPQTQELPRTGILNNLLSARPQADSSFRMQGVRTPTPAAPAPTPAAAPSTRERMSGTVDDLIAMLNEPRDTTRPEIDSRLEGLREPIIAATTKRMAPGYEDTVRQQVQREAETAYAVPQEYKDLIEARKKELETPLYTPEEAKSRRIDALLAGLASSNMIAQSGPRASAGINAVNDAIKKDSLDRASKSFDLSAGLMDKDMEGAKAAFGEGLKAMNTAMNQTSVSIQMAGSMLNQADNAAAASELQDRQERLNTLTSTISALGVIGTLERADIDAMTAAQRAATTELSSIQRSINTVAAALPMTPEENRAPLQAQLESLKLQEAAARNVIQTVNTRLGLETGGRGGSTGGSSALPPGFVPDQ